MEDTFPEEPKTTAAPALKDLTNKDEVKVKMAIKPPKKVKANVKMVHVQRYSEGKDGWIRTRAYVPVRVKEVHQVKEVRPESAPTLKKTTHSENYKRSIRHLYHKEKRYPCPDCTAWYGGDQKKLQLTCRHKERYETEEELKEWDISYGFSSDSD